MARPRMLAESYERELVRLYVEDDLSIAQVAERVALPWASVRHILKRHGVKLRRRGARKSEPRHAEIQLVCGLAARGLTRDAIAEIMGIGRWAVGRRLFIGRGRLCDLREESR